MAVGDDAPKLEIAHWMHGDAIEGYEDGKLYLLEFTSVRSASCRGRIKHLDTLQRRFGLKGLTVVCITGEHMRIARADVEELVEHRGDGLECTFGWDDGRKTTFAYMRRAQRKKLPCTFLVDGRGKIAYIGQRWVELAIEGVLAGKWDREVSERKISAAKALLRRIRSSIALRPASVTDRLEALEDAHPYELLTRIRRDAAFTAHLRTQSFGEASAVASRIIGDAVLAEDASRLNSVAWAIVDPRMKWKTRDLDVALRAAKQAARISGEKNAAILDTLARVWFWKKDFKRACEIQKRAIEAKDSQDTYRKTLAEYEAAMKGVD